MATVEFVTSIRRSSMRSAARGCPRRKSLNVFVDFRERSIARRSRGDQNENYDTDLKYLEVSPRRHK
jgi:hypothetical protein